MGHNIGVSRGRRTVFTAGEKAWHGLGVNVSGNLTAADAITAAALDWAVATEDAYTVGPDGLEFLEGVKAVRRLDTGKTIGTCGELWTPIQNVKAFEFMDSLVGEGLAMYHTAGALVNGSRIWIQAQVPKEIKIRGTQDVAQAFLTLMNKHTQGEAMRIWWSLQRVVCANTWAAAIGQRKGNEGASIRHSKDISEQVSDARKALGLAMEEFDAQDEISNRLAEKPVSDAGFREYLETLIPDNVDAENHSRTENIRMQVSENYADHEFPETAGTYWAAFNAVTRYVDHQRSARGENDADRARSRAESAMFGGGSDLKTDAWDLAVERAEIVLPALAN